VSRTTVVERSTKIFLDDYAYVVRPNSDADAIDIAYEEGGEEQRYICVTLDALPDLIAALEDALAHAGTPA
jgi:hypothetical protein